MKCDRCSMEVGKDEGPEDGWQLENGETVCDKCCVDDTLKIINEKLGMYFLDD